MTLPLRLSVTDRYKLKALTLEQSQVLPAGKIWWCRGRAIVNYGTLADLGNVFAIPRSADTLCVAAADYETVKEWLG